MVERTVTHIIINRKSIQAVIQSDKKQITATTLGRGLSAPYTIWQYSDDGVTWHEEIPDGALAIYMRESTDGGNTWSKTVEFPGNEIVATKADINSPEFTGTPTVPTATLGDVSQQIVNTSFLNTTLDEYQVKTYIHQQTTPSDVWVVTHNLKCRPSVSVVTSSGELVFGKVEYISDNELVIYFRAPFGGEAYLN